MLINEQFFVPALLNPLTICTNMVTIRSCCIHIQFTLSITFNSLKVIIFAIDQLPAGIHCAKLTIMCTMEIISCSIYIGEPTTLAISVLIEVIPVILTLPCYLSPGRLHNSSIRFYQFPSVLIDIPGSGLAGRSTSITSG